MKSFSKSNLFHISSKFPEIPADYMKHTNKSLLFENSETRPGLLYKKNSYIFPNYFKSFFNLTFAIFFTPFRAKFLKSENRIVAITYPLQMIICAVIHMLSFIVSLLWVRADLTGKIKDKPEQLFTIANYLCWVFYTIVYANMVWRKSVVGLFRVPTEPATAKTSVISVFLIAVGIILIIMYYMATWIFKGDGQIKPFLNEFTNTALYMTFRISDRNVTYDFYEIPVNDKALTIAIFIIDAYYNTILAFLELFNLIAAISLYEVSCKMQKIFFAKEATSVQMLLKHYTDMKKVFGYVNKVNGPVMLVVYVQIISWISSTTLETLDEVNWPKRIYMGMYYTLYVFTFYFAAEVNHKVEKFEKRIWEVRKQELVDGDKVCDGSIAGRSLVSIKCVLKGTMGYSENGLEGAKFFVVSYSFIGTSASVLLTFAMIMVQFRASSLKTSEGTND